MALFFALSPLVVVGVGAMLLMMAEAFSKRRGGLALGSTIILLTGAVFAAAVWLYGVEGIEDAKTVMPWLVLDRFTLFFEALLCLGGALAAMLAGGYLPEHKMDRGEFYSLILFATFGAMMLAASGD